LSTPANRAIIYLLSELAYTYHGANFLIFMLTNKKFSNEVKQIIPCLKKKSTEQSLHTQTAPITLRGTNKEKTVLE
jgi:hypothetical protein